MSTPDKIGNMAKSSVKSICDMISPSCIGCPSAKPYISADVDGLSDRLRVKISLRCEKMGMLGPACPDGGSPGGTYLKDLGVTRRLGEQLVAHSFWVDRDIVEGKLLMTEKELKSDSFSKFVGLSFKEMEDWTAKILHELDATLEFVTDAIHFEEPIIWRGETKYETFNRGREDYIANHIMPYRKNVSHSSGICKPTPYMQAHFPKAYSEREFAIVTDPPERAKGRRPVEAIRDESGDVRFFGDDPPKQPKTYTPPPSQEDIYEDWGSFA